MTEIKKVYKAVRENPAKVTHLRTEIYYAMGGMNYFTGKAEPHGYYVSVSPVTRSTSSGGFMMESYTGFTGAKQCIKEVTRKSKKAEAEALAAFPRWAEALENLVLNNQGLSLA
jgi:hypothetical protein